MYTPSNQHSFFNPQQQALTINDNALRVLQLVMSADYIGTKSLLDELKIKYPKVCFVTMHIGGKEYNSCKKNPVREWKQVSAIEFAAWAGDVADTDDGLGMLNLLLNYVPEEEKHFASMQLKQVTMLGTEYGLPLVVYEKLIHCLSHLAGLIGDPWITEESIQNYWDTQVERAQKTLPSVGIQQYCDSTPFDPLPEFKQAPIRSSEIFMHPMNTLPLISLHQFDSSIGEENNSESDSDCFEDIKIICSHMTIDEFENYCVPGIIQYWEEMLLKAIEIRIKQWSSEDTPTAKDWIKKLQELQKDITEQRQLKFNQSEMISRVRKAVPSLTEERLIYSLQKMDEYATHDLGFGDFMMKNYARLCELRAAKGHYVLIKSKYSFAFPKAFTVSYVPTEGVEEDCRALEKFVKVKKAALQNLSQQLSQNLKDQDKMDFDNESGDIKGFGVSCVIN